MVPMNPLRLFVVVENGQTMVFTQDALPGMQEAALQAAYGDAGKWQTVTFHEPRFSLQEEAKRRALVPHAELGFVIDPVKLPAERARVMVKEWTFDGTPGDLDAVPLEAANLIDQALQKWMYPTAFSGAAFTNALPPRAEPSAGASSTPKG